MTLDVDLSSYFVAVSENMAFSIPSSTTGNGLLGFGLLGYGVSMALVALGHRDRK